MNYYNEIDPYCAAWLQNLMDAGHIAPGVIDTRSIEDVTPNDLRGFVQCHFFAGLGGWAYALDLAGWPRHRPVWTGSCPCQPFSAAGKGAGFADERHLWPAFYHLIEQRRPPVVFGEQVASSAVDAWIDLVHADVEAVGYAFRSVPFPAAGVGAPHIRDRNVWVADAESLRLSGQPLREAGRGSPVGASHIEQVSGLANADGGNASAERQQRRREQRQQQTDGGVVRLADATISGRREERADGGRISAGDSTQGVAAGLEHGVMRGGLADADHAGEHALLRDESEHSAQDLRGGAAGGPFGQLANGTPQHGRLRNAAHAQPGAVNGNWRDADWLLCRDGKWRPVEPGTFPLADGIPNRVGRLRAYGNAIVPQAAAEFVKAYLAATS